MKYKCPCCENLIYTKKPEKYDICPICDWEYDPVQNKDDEFSGGANELSLKEAKKKYTHDLILANEAKPESPIKNIIFDIGMVLVDFRFREYMTEIGLSENDMQFLADNMILAPEWNYLDEGMDEDEFIKLMINKLPEYKKQIKLFFKDYSRAVESFDYSLSMINKLKELGYKVYLLSNYPNKMFKKHTKTSFTFIDAVDGMVISAFIKMRKPFPEIYKYLLSNFDLKPEECIFFDDKLENVEGAKKAGINAVQFRCEADVWNNIKF